jgi:hypothetical protein
MLQSNRSFALLALAASLALSVPAMAQAEKGKPATPATPAPAAKQPEPKGDKLPGAEWEKANQLSPEHVDLAKNLVGQWDTESSFWMVPGQAPQVSKGHATLDPIMGARFIKQSYEGEMEGKKFKGEGLFGYNTVSKEYETTWIDSSATGIMLSSGKKDAKGDIVFSGGYDDPMSGQKKTAKSVLHIDSRDKWTFTMYDRGTDGAEHKTLEVVYNRALPAGKPAAKPEGAKPDTKKEEKKGG